MKKILLCLLAAVSVMLVACGPTPQYDPQTSNELAKKVTSGQALTQEDYLTMINQSEAGLAVLSGMLKDAKAETSQQYDSVMGIIADDPETTKMIDNCLIFTRFLKDAPLDEKAREAYSAYQKKNAEFVRTYKHSDEPSAPAENAEEK